MLLLELLKEAEREKALAAAYEARRQFMEREHGIQIAALDEQPATALLARLKNEFAKGE